MDDKIDRLLQKHDAQLSQHMLEINSINHNVNVFKILVQEVRDRLNDVEALKDLHQKFNELSQYLKGEYQALVLSLDSLKREVADHQLKISQCKAFQTDLSAKLDETIAAQDRYLQFNSSKMREIECIQSENVAACRKEFQVSIEKLKNELTVSPASVFQQNKEVMNKLESAALDGTNAMLKVNNMDMKITIVEKKMENLAIQIKKIELEAQ